MQQLMRKEEWNDCFDKFKPKLITKITFGDILNRYLVPDPEKSVLEIGCSGGKFLCYLAKTFHYRPFGIDYSTGLEKTRETFRINGLPSPVLYQEDFFQWQAPHLFDVVCSFGFVEHFTNFEEVVQQHGQLVAPGGMLILSMPHIAHLQYLFHWLLNRKMLFRHNTRVTNLRALKKVLATMPFEILYLSYYRTFRFRIDERPLKPWEKILYQLIRRSGRRLRKIIGNNRPNFLISPNIICVAKKIEPK